MNPGGIALALVAVASILSGTRAVAAADPLLPSMPVALPSVPLPSLPLPTVPLPTLPLPTLPPPPSLPLPTLPPQPSLPLPTVPLPTVPLPTLPPPPTPTLPIPSATLPIVSPTLSPTNPSSSPSATLPSTVSPSPGSSSVGAGPIGSDGTLRGPEFVSVVASLAPGVGDPGTTTSPSLFDSISVPGLIIGVPLIIVLGILATQVAVGAAWLPVIRRWLGRRV